MISRIEVLNIKVKTEKFPWLLYIRTLPRVKLINYTTTASIVQAKRPHAVCFPSPAQSHISSTLKLAKLLHCRGFHITFVNTEFNHRRMVDARGGGPVFLDTLPSDFQFLTIPDGLPPSDASATQDINALCDVARTLWTAPFLDLIEGLNERATQDTSFPAVSCILSDGFMTFTTGPAGEKFGVPVVNLWTVSACVVQCFLQYPKLREKGFNSSRDVNCETDGYLDTIIDWMPGMKNMRLRDISNFIRTEADDVMFELGLDAMNQADQATATVIHTFDALEKDVLDVLSPVFSRPVYAIGPSSLLLDQIPEEKNHTSHVGCNMWREDPECLEWLDSKEPSSVLYINFGSIACLTPNQLVEFAMGIADSEHQFLWIIRPDLVSGDTAVLLKEFGEKTAGRGFMTDWCPQEKVLNHPSIGGFLTHCGWNSTIESLSAGVPMLCWPYFGDQPTNCRFVCTEWACGLEIDHDVKRGGVARLVKELMEGQNGKEIRKRAREWGKLAREATGPHGSSTHDLDRLVDQILSLM